jgi:hypothetical protein
VSVPKAAPAAAAIPETEEDDPVLRAFDNAPEDPNALTPEEMAAMSEAFADFDARVARGEKIVGKTTAEVLAEIAERAKREG